ncbi:MAG: 2-succinyl-5-enolpyruvyl-6-hydroxy-3-cyclohexene-1-carboxylate synthase [Paludibacteraceae bacterium]|nr:2-succinyl-5-enolpyruvyl-6-hydroxy-3-cyclohexene-1-carboxylate synthase [Paludibacteraceae bacterium]
MEGKYYSNERSVQILISLLKAHNVRKVVASPGTTNLSFVASMMYDAWFEIYSSVDERSAAYMACGLAAESGEPVVLSCTGATASRNYISAMTEAYYRKLPILAVTSTQDAMRVGHLIPQVIDRSVQIADTYILSEHINISDNENRAWDANVRINRALLELKHRGGGPVHLNFTTQYSRDYSVKELPQERVIHRVTYFDQMPIMPSGKVAIFVGAHFSFTSQQEIAIDSFCAANDAVVLCDHTSGYYGKYRVQMALVNKQYSSYDVSNIDLLIHIGEVSGDYEGLGVKPKQVWRVNEDGCIRDYWRKLTYVFEMPEDIFFEKYTPQKYEIKDDFLVRCRKIYDNIKIQIPELPFSNTWIAQQTAHRIPSNSIVHLGILNTLRNWNFFEFSSNVKSSCNTGGFGIDGIVSTLIGASLANKDQLHYLVVGDLAFFYDMNVVGNRHVSSNVRILLINNGKGTEFRNYNHPGAAFGEDADAYIAAGGHYGNKSPYLVKHYAEDLGFEYLAASSKEEFLVNLDRFTDSNLTDKPMIFEVFTNHEDESKALKMMSYIDVDVRGVLKSKLVGAARSVVGESGVNTIKNILKR